MEEIRKRNTLRWVCAALTALLLSMVILDSGRTEQLSAANTRVSAVYQKALYETCELTESIAGNYRKLLVAGDSAQLQLLLSHISRETQGAAGNLALLPLGEETVSATIKFINQAEDFAESLSLKLATGGELSAGDLETMRTLSENADRFSAGMEALLERYERGEAVFDAESFAETGDESLHPLTGSAADYPVLLYDGPFSDGAETGSYALLAALPEFSRAEAEAQLRSFLPVDVLSFTGESTPELPCYEFRLRSGEYWLNAIVTRQGGQLLYLLPEGQQDVVALDEPALYAIAENFLREKGYGEMEMSYSSRYNGILTINYAPVQDGVVLYPDLVKLQLSMKDGAVIGLDARNYLRNHRPRSIGAPALSADAAAEKIGNRLTPLSARLCIIPQNRAEYLCYEISAADALGDYLVYIDAETGVERELMQVISRENGTLVM